jgi:hypothetical protein
LREAFSPSCVTAAAGDYINAGMVGQGIEVRTVEVNDTLTERIPRDLIRPADKTEPNNPRPVGCVGHDLLS